MKVTTRATGAILVGVLLLVGVVFLGLEALTMLDAIPENHITAVTQRAFYAQPGVFLLLCSVVSFICGHLFWGTKPKPNEFCKLAGVDISDSIIDVSLENEMKDVGDWKNFKPTGRMFIRLLVNKGVDWSKMHEHPGWDRARGYNSKGFVGVTK